MIWDFCTGERCLVINIIHSCVSVWIPGFAVAFCIIALCIPGYHIYGFNHLWLTALRKTASVLHTHDIVSCHSLCSQPLSIYVPLGIMNPLEWLKAHRMVHTGSVHQRGAVSEGLMLPMTVVYKAFWVSPMGVRGLHATVLIFLLKLFRNTRSSGYLLDHFDKPLPSHVLSIFV